jgi:hypothetical protein
VATTGETISRLLMWRLMSVSSTSTVLSMPPPQQPALQLIYDTAPIDLGFLSPVCRYLQINQRLTEICGISVEDHLRRSVRDCVPALAAVEGCPLDHRDWRARDWHRGCRSARGSN